MIRLAIYGDLVPYGRVAQLLEKSLFKEVFSEVREKNTQFDFRLVNLECPILDDDIKGITKNGPLLKSKTSTIELLRYGFFDGVTLANNHFYDYGEEGVTSTLSALDANNIDHVGGGKDLSSATKTFFKKINGETLAIINCTEHEFSIADFTHGGSNPLNPIKQYYAIQEARKSANFVVVIVHGGIEYYKYPTPRMQETYRFFIDAGADAVVNHHQHCISGYEIYKEKPIFYGLGNFCFDYPSLRNNDWNYGYALELSLNRSSIKYQIYPYEQCNQTPSVKFVRQVDRSPLLKEIEHINKMISDEHALHEEYTRLLQSTNNRHLTLFTPYTSYLAQALCEKGFLPAYYPKRKWPSILNMIECESHRERLIYYIKNKMN